MTAPDDGVCGKGHDLASAGVYVRPATGRRYCRTCHNARQRAYRARLRDRKASS